MTGLDTNVLVRFAVADDSEQSRKVYELFQSLTTQMPGYIALVCIAEFVWVLKRKYRLPQERIVQWLERFLSMEQIIFENQEAVEQALRVYSTGNAGFSDCLIERAGHLAGCTSTVTFDKRAARAAGMKLL